MFLVKPATLLSHSVGFDPQVKMQLFALLSLISFGFACLPCWSLLKKGRRHQNGFIVSPCSLSDYGVVFVIVVSQWRRPVAQRICRSFVLCLLNQMVIGNEEGKWHSEEMVAADVTVHF